MKVISSIAGIVAAVVMAIRDKICNPVDTLRNDEWALNIYATNNDVYVLGRGHRPMYILQKRIVREGDDPYVQFHFIMNKRFVDMLGGNKDNIYIFITFLQRYATACEELNVLRKRYPDVAIVFGNVSPIELALSRIRPSGLLNFLSAMNIALTYQWHTKDSRMGFEHLRNVAQKQWDILYKEYGTELYEGIISDN